jgi:hypothetical protein
MDREEFRQMMPGKGDLQDIINDVLSLDDVDKVSLDDAAQIFDNIEDWVATNVGFDDDEVEEEEDDEDLDTSGEVLD